MAATDENATQEFDKEAIMKETLAAVEKLLRDALAEQDARRADELLALRQVVREELMSHEARRMSFFRRVLDAIMSGVNHAVAQIRSAVKEL